MADNFQKIKEGSRILHLFWKDFLERTYQAICRTVLSGNI